MKECKHSLGYEVLEHIPYESVTVSCLECGATISYSYVRGFSLKEKERGFVPAVLQNNPFERPFHKEKEQ